MLVEFPLHRKHVEKWLCANRGPGRVEEESPRFLLPEEMDLGRGQPVGAHGAQAESGQGSGRGETLVGARKERPQPGMLLLGTPFAPIAVEGPWHTTRPEGRPVGKSHMSLESDTNQSPKLQCSQPPVTSGILERWNSVHPSGNGNTRDPSSWRGGEAQKQVQGLLSKTLRQAPNLCISVSQSAKWKRQYLLHKRVGRIK